MAWPSYGPADVPIPHGEEPRFCGDELFQLACYEQERKEAEAKALKRQQNALKYAEFKAESEEHKSILGQQERLENPDYAREMKALRDRVSGKASAEPTPVQIVQIYYTLDRLRQLAPRTV